MSKPSEKVKRKLLDELNSAEAGSSKIAKVAKKNTSSKNGNQRTNTGKRLQNPNNRMKLQSQLIKKNNPKEGNSKLGSRKDNGVVKVTKKFMKIGEKATSCSRSERGQSKRLFELIIQTRSMKVKNTGNKSVRLNDNLTKEITELSKIDELSSTEIADGDRAFESNEEVDHDGIELAVSGSDVDEFPDSAPSGSGIEPGELSHTDNSDDEHPHLQHHGKVASKVVKVNKVTSATNKGQSATDKFSHLCNDPDFRVFLNEVLDERMSSKRNESSEDRSTSKNRKRKGTELYQNDTAGDLGQNYQSCVTNNVNMNSQLIHKSPSDTTLYSPGLRKTNDNAEAAIIDKISDFVENICLDNNRKERRSGFESAHSSAAGHSSVSVRISSQQHRSPGDDVRRIEPRHYSNIVDVTPTRKTGQSVGGGDRELTNKIADQLLVQAERFKACAEAPKGRNFDDILMPYDYEKLRSKFIRPEGLAPLDNEILFLHNFDQDDEFFHVTSQIDPSLRIKIERGEFIDLERLLPKDRNSRFGNGNEDLNKQLYQLITQGTNTYLDPPIPKTGKITNIRKWDQAFQVFAAIYTHANPERASEIQQYIYVIHTAAAANPWDNVYFYDVNFRELMASKPWRSWGKTYTQGWNMAFNNNNAMLGTGNHSSNSVASNNYARNKDWKDDCCWRYNKNRCKKTGSECNYDHHCTYCGDWNHGFHNCRKRQNKFKKRTSGDGKASTPKFGSPSKK